MKSCLFISATVSEVHRCVSPIPMIIYMTLSAICEPIRWEKSIRYFNPDFLSHLFSFDRKACEETGFTKFTVVHGWNRIHGWAYLWHRSIESNPMVNFGELYIKVFIIKWSQIVWIVKLLIFTRYRMLSGPRNYFLN